MQVWVLRVCTLHGVWVWTGGSEQSQGAKVALAVCLSTREGAPVHSWRCVHRASVSAPGKCLQLPWLQLTWETAVGVLGRD